MATNTTLALIGKGHWGKIYIKTINNMPHVTLPEKYIFTRDYQDKLKSISPNNIDGIIVATPSSTHFQVASYLLDNGFNKLLIEKPLTQKYSDARKLYQKYQKIKNARVMVGHVMLYDPAYPVLKKNAKKLLGKISAIHFSGLKSPPVTGSTVLLDWGPHPTYLFIDLAQSKPNQISAHKTKYDNVELTLKFKNNITATANIGTIFPERVRKIEVVGDNGKLLLNEFMNPRELLFINNQGKKTPISFPTNKTPLEMQILAFADYLTKGKKPSSSLSQGVEVIRIVESAQKLLK
jgi:predicted dehydrogenase